MQVSKHCAGRLGAGSSDPQRTVAGTASLAAAPKTTHRRVAPLVAIACLLVVHPGNLHAQQPFAELIGQVSAKPVQSGDQIPVPFITWGGDVATFQANGGLTTATGSTYQDMGLNLKLTPGDDFVQQVKDYLGGKTPFLRGTMRMLGQASEVLGRDARTKPVVILQISWSQGDHIVAREGLKTLNNLRRAGKKVRIACQQGGPHVGLLYDSLAQARIRRDEVDIEWLADLTGPNGPAEKFRQDDSIDACCVITPDMIGLTGGVDSTGSGAEGTVQGAHVLNSTQQMSRSIADVYAVRSDWYKSNKALVRKFVAGYLKGAQQLESMRNDFEKSGKMQPRYRQVLAMSQSIFGEDVLPTLEVDAHGLLLDCDFEGLGDQVSFFEDRGNLSGFGPKMSAALDLAVNWGYAKLRSGFEPSGLDYRQIAELAEIDLPVKQAAQGRFEGAELTNVPTDELDDNTILSFTISFEPNQSEFSADRYGAEFQRALEATALFGNAVVVIRGHSDPTKALVDLVRGGTEKRIIKRTGSAPNYKYFVKGRPLDLEQTEAVVKMIQTGAFEGKKYRPLQTVQAALNLSLARAEAVKRSLVNFAESQKKNLDASQLQPAGAGISDPVIPKPKSMAEARENMRVEFRVVRVPAETIQEDDFNF